MASSDIDPLDCMDEDPRDYRAFKDSVHDFIKFDSFICKIIDTPQFQRLRYLKQLGVSYFVFPSASHNRFEHCLGSDAIDRDDPLGTGYLARKLVLHLQQRQPSLGINDRDIQCVTIAGLCHDLGHGPFSHVFDNYVIPAIRGPRPDGTHWCHEEASEMMLDSLVRENDIPLSEDRIAFIKDLIRGEPRLSAGHNPPEKQFLFEIVANKRNGIDVDKWDYIARDTKAIGEGCTLVTSRLIEAARVVRDTIAYNWKDAQSVYELVYSRYSLHKRFYNHKTAKAIEHMIVDVLVEADPVYHIGASIDDPSRYLYMTDSILEDVERSMDPRLEKARAIMKDLRKRILPKRVEEKCLPWQYKKLWQDKLTPKAVADMSVKRRQEKRASKRLRPGRALGIIPEEGPEAMERTQSLSGDLLPATQVPSLSQDTEMDTDAETVVDEEILTENDVIIDFCMLHFGMKEKDPLEYVGFYGKESFQNFIRPDVSGHLRPQHFQELILRCYTRDESKKDAVQDAFREVLKTLPDLTHSTPPPQAVVFDTAKGPPRTPANPPRELQPESSMSPAQFPNQFLNRNQSPPKSKKRQRDESPAVELGSKASKRRVVSD
ncbi:hypothetical protein FRB99_008334 [Tulasnella sp. 403]|nr:hypothetical protein FRB99_008334 [Tulasnella sp. 403]